VLASKTTEKKYFYGLPSPGAAAFMVGFIWIMLDMDFTGDEAEFLALLVTVAAGVLMVASTIKYPSFKDLRVEGRVPFRYMLLIVVGFLLILFDPPKMLFLIVLFYVCLGPLMWWRQKSAARTTSA
jgi:CDP-diacylglycerol--serine O-phosphatidyltransferase